MPFQKRIFNYISKCIGKFYFLYLHSLPTNLTNTNYFTQHYNINSFKKPWVFAWASSNTMLKQLLFAWVSSHAPSIPSGHRSRENLEPPSRARSRGNLEIRSGSRALGNLVLSRARSQGNLELPSRARARGNLGILFRAVFLEGIWKFVVKETCDLCLVTAHATDMCSLIFFVWKSFLV